MAKKTLGSYGTPNDTYHTLNNYAEYRVGITGADTFTTDTAYMTDAVMTAVGSIPVVDMSNSGIPNENIISIFLKGSDPTVVTDVVTVHLFMQLSDASFGNIWVRPSAAVEVVNGGFVHFTDLPPATYKILVSDVTAGGGATLELHVAKTATLVDALGFGG